MLKTLIVFFLLLTNALYAQDETPYLVHEIRLLDVNSSINPATFNYLESEIKKLSPELQTLMVIKLNTPGGLLSTTKDILTLIGSSSHPVAIWVTPEGASATSAGAIIASGAHFIFMNEGTNMGAATPIEMNKDIPESDGKKKVINDTVSLVRSLSELRGRNPQVFEDMVTKASSLTQKEALEKKAIDGKAHSVEDIRAQLVEKKFLLLGKKRILNFAPALVTKEIPMDPGLSLLNILSHPNTCYLLFLLGVALIYFEFQAPGGYIAGGIGVMSLVLAAIGFQVLPLNMGAALLMIAGVILLALEVFIVSYGLLSVAGLAALGFGALFIYRTEDNFIQIQSELIWSSIAGVGFFLLMINFYILRERKKIKPHQGFGDRTHMATILNILSPELYQVKVNGEIWKARGVAGLQMNQSVEVKQKTNKELILDIIKTKDS
jgi:membrane-bound serine protease (ClpP class)